MRITFKDIVRQVKADLIGKDSYRGVTLSYAWLANQLGHFALGYIPTLVVYAFLKKCTSWHEPAFIAAVMVSALWLLFELFNFLGPLLLNRVSSSKLLYVPSGRSYTFPPFWLNIAFDTFTDVCFFVLGSFSAALFLLLSYKIMLVIGLVFCLLLYPSYYWYKTKIYLQEADYPFQFRLSQWDSSIGDPYREIVYRFLNHYDGKQHLLIFGNRKSGKSSLGTAIASELSIKHRFCKYLTAMKLYSHFFENTPYNYSGTSFSSGIWDWKTCSLLVIDDINPGAPLPHDITTPREFLKMLDAYTPGNDTNRKILREKSVIWILGQPAIKPDAEMDWSGMLEEIGVRKENIHSIYLPDSYLP